MGRLSGHTLLVAVVAPAVLVSVTFADEAKPRIAETRSSLDGDRVLVSFRVDNAFTEESVERIRSGAPVVFRHRIELLARRSVPLMPYKVVARAIVETRAEYDPLTRRYALQRTIEVPSHDKQRSPSRQQQSAVTEVEAEMQAWMTELQRIELYDPARTIPTHRKLKIKVNSALGRRYVLMIFPSTVDASAEWPLEP